MLFSLVRDPSVRRRRTEGFSSEDDSVKVWKEIISPGTYWYTDDAGVPHKFEATPERIRHLHEQGNKMLSVGLSVPVPVEHQVELAPMTAAQKAAAQLLNNAGWIDKYALRPGDKLFGLLDIPDPKIAAALPRTIKFTSPHISSFTDGDGKKWDGVISHLALTSRPRIVRQEPFQSVGAALSLAQTSKTNTGLVLSRAGKLTKSGVPEYPMAFSIWSGVVKLAVEEPPVKEKKEKESKEPPAKKEGHEEAVEMVEEMEEDLDLVDIFCDLMSIFDVEMPEGTDESNLLQHALKALMEKLKVDNGGGMGDDTMSMGNDSLGGAPPNQKPPIEEKPPLYMSANLSLADVEKITDPKEKAFASAMFSMQQRTAALVKSKLDEAGDRRKKRIERLVNKAGATGREALKTKLEAINALPSMAFSLAEDGQVLDPMAALLDSIDAAMLDLPSVMLSGKVREEEPPLDISHYTDSTGRIISEARRKEVVEELATAAGVPAPAK